MQLRQRHSGRVRTFAYQMAKPAAKHVLKPCLVAADAKEGGLEAAAARSHTFMQLAPQPVTRGGGGREHYRFSVVHLLIFSQRLSLLRFPKLARRPEQKSKTVTLRLPLTAPTSPQFGN